MSLLRTPVTVFDAPTTRIDGFPAAITVDLQFDNDLSDMGTGLGRNKHWTQADIENAATRAVANLTDARRNASPSGHADGSAAH